MSSAKVSEESGSIYVVWWLGFLNNAVIFSRTTCHMLFAINGARSLSTRGNLKALKILRCFHLFWLIRVVLGFAQGQRTDCTNEHDEDIRCTTLTGATQLTSE